MALAAPAARSAPAGERPDLDRVFQYKVAVKIDADKTVTAELWVPPQADRIRGAVVGGMREAGSDPSIRRACRQEKIAIAIVPLDKTLPAVMAELGRASGHPELAVAPWFGWGHSAGTVTASYFVAENPARCFGAILLKGGLCPPPGRTDAPFVGVPILQVKGQFEEFGPGPSGVLRDFEDTSTGWQTARDEMVKLRQADERHLVSLAIVPGETHMVWTPADGAYAAQFLAKAAQRRIPDWPVDAKEPVQCVAIDPRSGGLSSSRLGEDNQPAPASWADYTGDRKQALWHFDAELAKANDAVHAALLKRKPQFLSFADAQGRGLPLAHDMRLRLPKPQFVGPDVVKLSAAFLDAPPKKYPPATGPVGHADGPILFRVYGPLEQVGPDTFRVAGAGAKLAAGILAYHPGDGVYRYAEQLGRLDLPRLEKGAPQTIAFALAENVARSAFPLKLEATSDRGLPVRFIVRSGAAIVRDGKLELADVPHRAAWPLAIEVMAYQYGSAVEPLVQSAEPVRRTVLVTQQ
jgi:hypothetical protein